MESTTVAAEPKLSGLATNILELLQQRDGEELSDPAWSVVDLSDELLRTEEAVKAALVDELEPAGLAIEIDADHWCIPADPDELGEAGWAEAEDAVAAAVEAEVDPPADGPDEWVECPHCDGVGHDEEGNDCHLCGGRGTVVAGTDLVPAGDGAVEVVEPLTADEQAELARLEGVVADGVKAIFVSGLALRDIRDRRLYRELHGTFEQYVEDRLGVSSSHAYRWIEAAEVQANVSGAGLRIERESHARELAQLPAASQAEVFRRAQESAGNGRLTAKQIAEAREAFMVERVVAIVEAAGQPIEAVDVAANMDGVTEWQVRGALTNAADRKLIHNASGGWPEKWAAGPKLHTDQKVTIPAALVERHARAGIKQHLEYWVQSLVEAALDEAEAGQDDGTH